jgi:thioredoxin reductase
MHDVGIIGAGPAGLNAALLLGRCRRDVVLIDSGHPRNAASRGLHGFLSRDGIPPLELRELGRKELTSYPTLQFRNETITGVQRRGGCFILSSEQDTQTEVRMLLLATGRADLIPARTGFAALYGRGVYHCPLCDGWEHRGEPLIAYGRGASAFELALTLLTWSRQVTLCSDGACALDGTQRQRLAANHIAVVETEVSELHAGGTGFLDAVRLANGARVPCRALFFVSETPQRTSLPENLGCTFDESGGVVCHGHAATNVPGLFVAGNVRCGIHLAITAAAEGAEAAIAINEALLERELI